MQAIIQYYDIKIFLVFSFLEISAVRRIAVPYRSVQQVSQVWLTLLLILYTMETGIWGIFTAVNFNPAIAQLHSNLLKTYINQLVETVIAR